MFKPKKLLTLILLCLTFFAPANKLVASSECVQVLEQDDELVNLNVTTLNIADATNSSIPSYTPTIPPNGLFSPDGKFSAFWQKVSGTEVGFYVGNIATGKTFLLYKHPYKDLWVSLKNPVASWSATGNLLAYISQEGKRFFLNIVNSSGDAKRSVKILDSVHADSLDDQVWIKAWSADNQYISLIVHTYEKFAQFNIKAELVVVKVSDFSIPLSGVMIVTPDDYLFPAAWSPTGHRLVMLVWDNPAKWLGTIQLWSPEHGVETAVSAPITTEYYDLSWLPDSRFVHMYSSSGHVSWDDIYYFKAGMLVKDVPSGEYYRSLMGWIPNFGVLVTDLVPPKDRSDNWTATLLVVQPNGGHSKLAELGNVSETQVSLSPDANYVSYFVQERESYKVFLSASDGTGKQQLFANEQSLPHLSPQDNNFQWSPDGKYLIADWNAKKHSVWSADGKRHWDLDDTSYTSWLDEHWLIYSATEKDKSQLVLLNLDDGKSINLHVDEDGFSDANLSPNKRFAAIAVGDHILVVPLDRVSPEPIRFNITKYIEWFSQRMMYYRFYDKYGLGWKKYALAWSSDSSKLAFIDSLDNDHQDIVAISTEGKELLRSHLHIENGYGLAVSIKWVSCDASKQSF